MQKIIIEAPIRIKSQANLRQHWRVKSAERKKNLRILKVFMPKSLPPMPVKITLTRVAPRLIDDDNLQFAMKEFRDFVADAFIPGLPMGRADNDKRLHWCYDQRQEGRNNYMLRIILQSLHED